jgi:DMSO/TMAO reductase YedYZ molybdopterin-dependent catalytic subunit
MNENLPARRNFIKMLGLMGAAGPLSGTQTAALETDLIQMPFANGGRRVEAFPQKRPLILLRTRPPLLETPMGVFNNGVFTPNDAFYLRWHLADIPTAIDVDSYRLRAFGHVQSPLEIHLRDLVQNFAPFEIAAVNQCSGNSRGFFSPRVPGGEWGNAAMGNALWIGVRLKDLLARAAPRAGAHFVRFNGLDKGTQPNTPDFLKSLDIDHAMDGEVMIAYGQAQFGVSQGVPDMFGENRRQDISVSEVVVAVAGKKGMSCRPSAPVRQEIGSRDSLWQKGFTRRGSGRCEASRELGRFRNWRHRTCAHFCPA